MNFYLRTLVTPLTMTISKDLIQFLKDLEQNNNKEWFEAHKATFQEHQKTMKTFFAEVADRLRATDDIESHKVFRIYRDVRFSKDKTPYKSWFAGSFKRAEPMLRGGYYLSVQPGHTKVGGGFYGPSPTDLLRIRREFEQNDSEIRAILDDKKFKSIFGELMGEEVKTAPKGFSADHPAIDLIRKKQFYVMRSFNDAEVTKPDFQDKVVETFLALRPYFDYMSSVLTTNLDGEVIVK